MRKQIEVIKNALDVLAEVDDPVLLSEVKKANKAIGEIEADYMTAYEEAPA